MELRDFIVELTDLAFARTVLTTKSTERNVSHE